MALDVEITRTELPGSPGNLELNAGDFRWDPSVSGGGGGVIWNRREVSSPYVHGATLVTATKGMVLQPAKVIVLGSSNADLRGNVNDLIEAVSQFDYSITIDADSSDPGIESMTWYCEPADYSTNTYWLEKNQLITEVMLSIPRQPVGVGSKF